MKKVKRLNRSQLLRMSSFVLGVSAGLFFAGNSQGLSEGTPCAVVEKTAPGTQVIPLEGKVVTRFHKDTPIACGAMVITHAEPMWITLSTHVLIKIAPNSFLELAKSAKESHRLYRGDLLLTASGTGVHETLTTPNGKIDFIGGTIWVQYSAAEKETSVASFARTAKFYNKFSDQSAQDVRAGELSHIRMQSDRVVPTQAEVIHPSSVREVVARFGLPKEEVEELVSSAERVFEGRSKSFVAELENWKDVEVQPERNIASVKNSSIDVNEAEHTMMMMKEHLYGSTKDLKSLDEEEDASARHPASAVPKTEQKLSDPLYEAQLKSKAAEKKRLIQKVSEIQVEEQ